MTAVTGTPLRSKIQTISQLVTATSGRRSMVPTVSLQVMIVTMMMKVNMATSIHSPLVLATTISERSMSRKFQNPRGAGSNAESSSTSTKAMFSVPRWVS